MSKQYCSWGNYPYFLQDIRSPSWRMELADLLTTNIQKYDTTLAYGNGRSYGDSCLAASDHIIAMRSLNRFIAVDWQKGVVRAEAGVTLGEVLEQSIKYGWFLAVTPGTQFATLGGAIANDVHGKNHHRRGTFGKHVLRFGLLRSEKLEITCSQTENSELFAATVGGLGLTGIITWVEIQLIPIYSSQINSQVIRFNNLDEFFDLSNELDQKYEYSVAWVDCVASGKNLGRGVFIVGEHADYGDMLFSQPKRLTVPITPPSSLVNTFSLKLFNELYWRKHPNKLTPMKTDYYPFFYPLDNILSWNRIYGKKGFQQYQCVIPKHNSKEAIKELLVIISQQKIGSFLAVLKCCGDISSPGLLSFPLEGISLALDFPQNEKLMKQLFPKLDAVVRESEGRLYPAKDAHMNGEDFRKAYPAWKKLEILRDPCLNSRFWQRVTA